jgi:hypothetical protein
LRATLVSQAIKFKISDDTNRSAITNTFGSYVVNNRYAATVNKSGSPGPLPNNVTFPPFGKVLEGIDFFVVVDDDGTKGGRVEE